MTIPQGETPTQQISPRAPHVTLGGPPPPVGAPTSRPPRPRDPRLGAPPTRGPRLGAQPTDPRRFLEHHFPPDATRGIVATTFHNAARKATTPRAVIKAVTAALAQRLGQPLSPTKRAQVCHIVAVLKADAAGALAYAASVLASQGVPQNDDHRRTPQGGRS